MPLSVKRTATAAAVGAIDIGIWAAGYSIKQLTPTTGTGSFTDPNIILAGRLTIVLGGAAAGHAGKGTVSEVGEAAMLAGIPLLEKSIANKLGFGGVN